MDDKEELILQALLGMHRLVMGGLHVVSGLIFLCGGAILVFSANYMSSPFRILSLCIAGCAVSASFAPPALLISLNSALLTVSRIYGVAIAIGVASRAVRRTSITGLGCFAFTQAATMSLALPAVYHVLLLLLVVPAFVLGRVYTEERALQLAAASSGAYSVIAGYCTYTGTDAWSFTVNRRFDIVVAEENIPLVPVYWTLLAVGFCTHILLEFLLKETRNATITMLPVDATYSDLLRMVFPRGPPDNSSWTYAITSRLGLRGPRGDTMPHDFIALPDEVAPLHERALAGLRAYLAPAGLLDAPLPDFVIVSINTLPRDVHLRHTISAEDGVNMFWDKIWPMVHEIIGDSTKYNYHVSWWQACSWFSQASDVAYLSTRHRHSDQTERLLAIEWKRNSAFEYHAPNHSIGCAMEPSIDPSTGSAESIPFELFRAMCATDSVPVGLITSGFTGIFVEKEIIGGTNNLFVSRACRFFEQPHTTDPTGSVVPIVAVLVALLHPGVQIPKPPISRTGLSTLADDKATGDQVVGDQIPNLLHLEHNFISSQSAVVDGHELQPAISLSLLEALSDDQIDVEYAVRDEQEPQATIDSQSPTNTWNGIDALRIIFADETTPTLPAQSPLTSADLTLSSLDPSASFADLSLDYRPLHKGPNAISWQGHLSGTKVVAKFFHKYAEMLEAARFERDAINRVRRLCGDVTPRAQLFVYPEKEGGMLVFEHGGQTLPEDLQSIPKSDKMQILQLILALHKNGISHNDLDGRNFVRLVTSRYRPTPLQASCDSGWYTWARFR